MLIKLADMGEAAVIDFREMAPAASKPDMFIGADGKVVPNSTTLGGLASGTPGDVAGLLYALENYGSKKFTRAQIMQPAIDLAENGYRVTPNLFQVIRDSLEKINTYPATAAIYTIDGLPPELGDTIKNPDLGKTLRLIAEGGADAFYKGPLAQQTAAAVRDAGGIITAEDLANYQVKVRKPVTGTYRGYTIISVPPASSGGTHLIEMLNMLENIDMGALEPNSVQEEHAWIQALRLVFADRGKYMADTDFVEVPLAGLTSKAYAKELFAKFNPDAAMLSADPGEPAKYESGSTTSFSVMDKAGNMVTVTKTINNWFGSGVTVPGAGFIMNDEMDDFAFSNPKHIQAPYPYRRPLSSMTPTIVLDPQGQPFMTLGTPGGPRIFPTLAGIISYMIDHGMSLQDAIMAPRRYASASGTVHTQQVPAATVEGLKAMGYDVNVYADWDPYFGAAQGVHYDRKSRTLYGGADPRRDGQAAAY
jgi:gamma-glutamyltranspeptidase/glutathione hydrolase